MSNPPINLFTPLQHLRTLQPESTPRFGIMNAQQMIEHLAMVVCICNGKIKVECKFPPERVAVFKSQFIAGDQDLPEGVQFDRSNTTPPPLRTASITGAIELLEKEITLFHQVFEENPDQIFTHTFFGEMGFEEWKTFQRKHFRHHFKQFNLPLDF
jgi:hydroxymethylglutaryl-CoA reductase